MGEISVAQLQVMSLSEQRWSGVHHLLRDLEHAVARVPSREKDKGRGRWEMVVIQILWLYKWL